MKYPFIPRNTIEKDLTNLFHTNNNQPFQSCIIQKIEVSLEIEHMTPHIRKFNMP